MSQPLELKSGLECCYLGPHLDRGALPTLIYFSLSAKESLELAPYNAPAKQLEKEEMRIFSFSIPGHEEGLDKFLAMQYWADAKEPILEHFFEKMVASFDELFQKELITPGHFGLAGLSRGAFIATHLAAREKRVNTLLGFAPLTKLSLLSEFEGQEDAHLLDLERLTEKLLHIQSLRFYIGGHDTRVDTDACYHFIRALIQRNESERTRHSIELRITPSIGHQGHGTAPETFAEGSEWIKERLLS